MDAAVSQRPSHRFELTDEQIASFHEDGFVIVDRIVDPGLASAALARFEPMFSGTFETGLYPDEWNWRPGRDDPSLTRQICNGWKSDRDVAAVVLREDVGQACATLGGWPGTRLSQDNVLWKPPGGRPLGFHQDAAYDDWAVPAEFVSCWVALDRTTAGGGTLEFVAGSHRWRSWGMIEEFHGPEDPERDLRKAAELEGVEVRKVAVEVPPGGGAFHSGRTWHGSGRNLGSAPRRTLVAHCTTSEARFSSHEVGYIYSRYKRFGDDSMDETHFPITWREDGYRSPFIRPYVDREIGWGG
ncbi:phytanoyl-CoA dioxygenase family protein [Pseudonocardia spinosispora]|uniref:phytanoyl-CoA dioxygenase family protein n=1 Tax=Pseudonocardia spinosispora TaxID=103441 RepID=UPI000425D504|nr:phytanoyl-CoA dioxygenase family protein [Pseudonocardia spinosispora]